MPLHREPVIRCLLALACAGLAACEDGQATVDAALDAAPADGAGLDATPDTSLDAGPDGGDPDGDPATDLASGDAAVDAAPDADPALAPCAVIPSPRGPDALRVAGCRLVREGEAAALPRVVVVSGDSLARAAATPLHEPPMWADLRGAGVELVWMVVLWTGIEPAPGTYNGAYSGRICQSVQQAADAGLDVVLAMTQHRFGPALGGHGMPDWATPAGLAPVPAEAGPDHPSLAAAWRAFWDADDGAGPAGLEAAWVRLLDTCALEERHGIDGIAVLGAPIGAPGDLEKLAALGDRVEAAAEARLGPLLRFEYGLWVDGELRWPERPGPDRVRVVPGWGPARWPGAAPAPAGWRVAARDAAVSAGRPLLLAELGGETPDVMDAALSAAEADGLIPAIWQDGLGTPYGLRDEEGRPAALWAPALDRPGPARLAGRVRGWGFDGETLTLRWAADGSAQGLSRIDLAGRQPGEARLTADEGVEWFSDYDPVTGLLAVFVEGAVGIVELAVPLQRP